MIIEANAFLMQQHGIAVEVVTAHQHSAHGLVERRMAFFNDHMGLFNIGQAGMSKTEAGNYMRCIAARLNDKPYGLRFLNKMDTGLHGVPPDLEMETIAPNHWKLTHRKNSPNAAFVHLPKDIHEHQSAVSINLRMIADFFDTKLLPRLLLDIDRSRTITDTPLSLDSIVLFWPEGNDSIRPKGSQPKLARVFKLETGPDGKQRTALLSYIKASQVLLSDDYQIQSAPFKDTWRRIDELIPVDDASHQRSVQAMLDKASSLADTTKDDSSLPGQDQLPSATPENPMDTDQPLPLADMNDSKEIETRAGGINLVPDKLETDTTLRKVVNAPVATPTSQAVDDEDLDIDNDRGTDIDPNYTAVIQHGNTERRTTRATRNTSIPHCSLLIQVKQLLQQSEGPGHSSRTIGGEFV